MRAMLLSGCIIVVVFAIGAFGALAADDSDIDGCMSTAAFEATERASTAEEALARFAVVLANDAAALRSAAERERGLLMTKVAISAHLDDAQTDRNVARFVAQGVAGTDLGEVRLSRAGDGWRVSTLSANLPASLCEALAAGS